MPHVAIIGASANRAKYGNKAVRAYREQGWTVYPVHPHEKEIEGIIAYPSIRDIQAPIDRVAIYVPPEIGIQIIGDIAAVKPKEVFFNPGSEDEALLTKAAQLGVHPIRVCAIVDIGKQPSDYS